jgi:negative regulator of flagellin synthesis FlgM
MRVDNNQAGRATATDESSAARKTEKSRQAKSTQTSGASDSAGSTSAEISTRAREAAKAKAIADAAPDIREARIAELKKKIANNEYNVKPEAIADRLVDEHLSTRGMD